MAKSVVVDASLVIKWLLVEEGSERANKHLQEWLNSKTKIYAPDFLLLEVHQALWKRVQRAEMTRDAPIFSLTPTFGLALDWVSIFLLLPRATTLGLEHGITVYDSLYAALAERLNCPLYTADKSLGRGLAGSGIVVENL